MLTVRACRPQRVRELRLLDLVTPTTNRNINQIKIRNPHKMQILCPPEKPQYLNTRKNIIRAQRDVRRKNLWQTAARTKFSYLVSDTLNGGLGGLSPRQVRSVFDQCLHDDTVCVIEVTWKKKVFKNTLLFRFGAFAFKEEFARATGKFCGRYFVGLSVWYH